MISCFNVLSIICLLKEQRICSVAFLGNSDVLCRFQLSHILQGERHHGGLSRNGSHRLVCSNAQYIGSGTIRGIALLEEVYHCGGRFEVSYAQVTPIMRTVHFLFPVDQDVELSTTSPEPCLPACCLASCLDDNVLNL